MISYDPLWKTLEERGIKQKQLAETAGIHENLLCRMKNGGVAKTETIDKICKALGCEITDVVRYVPDQPQDNLTDTSEE